MTAKRNRRRRRLTKTEPCSSTAAVTKSIRGPRQIEVSFRRFNDGTIVDLIHPKKTGLQLIVSQGGSLKIRPYLQKGREFFVPPNVDHKLLNRIRFPAEIGKYPDTRVLFDSILKAARCYLDLSDDQFSLLAAFVLSTWVYDRCRFAPYLSIVGPLGSGKTTLLQFLSCCCRRALLLMDIGCSALYSLSDRLQPTLLIDEIEFGRDSKSRELLKLLRGGHTSGVYGFRSSKTFDVFGPKVLSSRLPVPDVALASRFVQISMFRSRSQRVGFSLDDLEHVASTLQPMLTKFRINNYDSKFCLQVDTRGLSPRSKDIAVAFAGPLMENVQLQESIVDIVREMDQEAITSHSREPEMLVLRALYCCYHEARGLLTVGMVAEQVNDELEKRGERRRFVPRAVGPILRQLGYPTSKIGSVGMGIHWSEELERRLHTQVRTYQLSIDNVDRCGICQEFPKLVKC